MVPERFCGKLSVTAPCTAIQFAALTPPLVVASLVNDSKLAVVFINADDVAWSGACRGHSGGLGAPITFLRGQQVIGYLRNKSLDRNPSLTGDIVVEGMDKLNSGMQYALKVNCGE